MTPHASDTIAAIATPPGAGGVGIVRISGPAAHDIAHALTGTVLAPRVAKLVRYADAGGETIDRGLALHFPKPRSFTGEDVVELHAHGSRIVLAELVARCVALGARHARPGEFSERAFVNGKIDLVQAEAIADLIAAGSQAQARAALRSLDGEFSRRVATLLDALIRLRIHVEAAIDFPEEEIDFLGEPRVLADLRALRAAVAETLEAARCGQKLREGLHVVIVGRPNAGKSSLLNALAGADRAIVTEIPGTTRDVLRETVAFDGIELTLADTAGLRETDDPVEREGVRRARAELERADLLLAVVDAAAAAAGETARQLVEERGARAAWLVYAQIDRTSPHRVDALLGAVAGIDALAVSARTGAGLDALRARLRVLAGAETDAGTFSARQRHVDALARVAAHLAEGEAQLVAVRAGELVADELRQAQRALSEITGEYTSDDLLGAIFSSFCIGK